jgi:hypothetical protein
MKLGMHVLWAATVLSGEKSVAWLRKIDGLVEGQRKDAMREEAKRQIQTGKGGQTLVTRDGSGGNTTNQAPMGGDPSGQIDVTNGIPGQTAGGLGNGVNGIESTNIGRINKWSWVENPQKNMAEIKKLSDYVAKAWETENEYKEKAIEEVNNRQPIYNKNGTLVLINVITSTGEVVERYAPVTARNIEISRSRKPVHVSNYDW